MLNQSKKIYIVGIKGVAMSNLAIILKKMGKEVAGSDIEEEFITDELLKKNKIAWQVGFDPKNVPANTDLIVYSAAHRGDKNPQVKEAKKRGIKIISQAELLGRIIKEFKTAIAVCGCHGKTTTSSLLSYALIKLGAKPSYLIGSSDFNGYPGGDFTGKNYFVVEADEYGVNPPFDLTPKFHYLAPDYILCTNIDFDHPDIYNDLNEVKKAYLKFFEKMHSFSSNDKKYYKSSLIFCADDESLMTVAKRLPKMSFLTYGYGKKAHLQIVNAAIKSQHSSFELVCHPELIRLAAKRGRFDKISLGTFQISLFGEKNVSNAAGVILALLRLGFSPDKIKKAIADFTGAKRRFELLFEKNGTLLFDDYAHHPNEIKASISAARLRFPGKRIIIIFQPHTFSRTQILLKDFAESLSLADQVFILPIFSSARENPKNFKITSKDLVKLSPNTLIFADSKSTLYKYLISNIRYQDIVFTMGAGDVYKLKDDIIKIIASR